MATRNYTVSHVIDASGSVVPGALRVQWTLLANGDDGQPFVLPSHADKSIQFYGTFGAGGSITLQGTNEQTYSTGINGGVAVAASNYVALTDPQANAITKTAAAIEQVLENPNAVRPIVTAGDGTTSLTAVLIVRSAKLAA